MESWQICGIGILTAAAALIIRQMRSEMALTVRLAGNLILLGAVLAMSMPIYSYINYMVGRTVISEYSAILVKALSVALITHISAGVCRDCGENSVASCVELAGRCEILLLSLPLISSIVGIATDIAGWNG